MDLELVKIALGGLVLLGCIGLFFGIGLALAAHKFAVEVNPLIGQSSYRGSRGITSSCTVRRVWISGL